jgi:cellulose synthase/poly-beta-1,6-N-acetylglucosamine synthase-like glycosyltransferase
MNRKIAVAIPARNEAADLPACLDAVGRAARFAGYPPLHIVVLANNCDDDTAALARGFGAGPNLSLHLVEARLTADRAHAGWARRLALDAADAHLERPGDLLLSTDADTIVQEDWLARTLPYIDAGYDAVAGLARLNPRELRMLPAAHRARLATLRRYDHAMSYLKAARDVSEPWPRHFYEGGASIAVTHAAYRASGGAPTPKVGEDKALFDAVRAVGGKVRHPTDVRVLTSPRLAGRAPGGTSDTLALWGRLAQDDVVPGVETIAEGLGLKAAEFRRLSFQDLPDEVNRARDLVRLVRQTPSLAEVG